MNNDPRLHFHPCFQEDLSLSTMQPNSLTRSLGLLTKSLHINKGLLAMSTQIVGLTIRAAVVTVGEVLSKG